MKNILLAGNTEKIIPINADMKGVDIYKANTLIDAVEYATTEKPEFIIIEMSQFGPKLENAIVPMRLKCPSSRIVLLCEMYEEPWALRLTKGFLVDGRPAADEYFILPIRLDEFKSILKIENKDFLPDIDISDIYTDENKDARIRELEKLATEDDLTGAKNRRYIREFLRQTLSLANDDQMQVTLLLFDIDNFKKYNDLFGHAVGDDILRQVTALMRKCCRVQDVIGRIGGDEFAVVFWDYPAPAQELSDERRAAKNIHPREVRKIADRFLHELNSTEFPLLGPQAEGTLSISGGLATYPTDGTNVGDLFKKADECLLEAKREGKNRIYLVGHPE